MTHLCRAANLRALLRQPELREVMGEALDYYIKLLNEDPRGTRIRDAMTLEERPMEEGVPSDPPIVKDLDPSIFNSLLARLNDGRTDERSRYVDERQFAWDRHLLTLHHASTECKHVKIGGVNFKAERASAKDSNVVYSGWREADGGKVYAGRIIHIFLHTRPIEGGSRIKQTFLAIRRLRSLNHVDAGKDIFRRYGKDGGFLCHPEYEESIDIVTPSEVLCHSARTPYSAPDGKHYVHVLPLDRVCTKFDLSRVVECA